MIEVLLTVIGTADITMTDVKKEPENISVNDPPPKLSLRQSIELQNAVPAAKGKRQKAAHQSLIAWQIACHVTVNNLSLATMLTACKAPVAAEIKKEILESQVLKLWKYPMQTKKKKKEEQKSEKSKTPIPETK